MGPPKQLTPSFANARRTSIADPDRPRFSIGVTGVVRSTTLISCQSWIARIRASAFFREQRAGWALQCRFCATGRRNRERRPILANVTLLQFAKVPAEWV